MHGKNAQKVWYIVTETTDKGNADAVGINYSPKLIYSEQGARTATLANNTLVFQSGTVDFSPEHKVEPCEEPNAFPPTKAKPGAVGDKDYSPLVLIENAGSHIYNAPIIAYDVDTEDI